jgi:glycosyltransferase involved in cell wall biosynthesis
MRIALLTEGGYPYARGESVVWCDRLLRGLGGHEFEVYALSRSARQAGGPRCQLPPNVGLLRTAPLWDAPGARVPGEAWTGARGSYGRRERRRFDESFGELAAAVCAGGQGAAHGGQLGPRARESASSAEAGERPGGVLADRFAAGLYGLADLARDRGRGLGGMLRSESAVRILQSACRAPGALRAVQSARVADLLAVAERLERALRPLSLDWYGHDAGEGQRTAAGGSGSSGSRDGFGTSGGLAEVDLCHAVGAGPAALPGLLAKRFFGTPLLITEYGVRVREHYLASAAAAVAAVAEHTVPPVAAGAPVRALLASFQRQLAREAYTVAQLVTPGNTHARRWQERCGAPPAKLRTVYPGMDAAPFAELGERAGAGARARGEGDGDGGGHGGADGDGATLVWAGRIEPDKDLIGLLHAFAEVRRAVPCARLRIVATARGRGPGAVEYESRCRALAAQLFPDEAADSVAVGENPVSFEKLGDPSVPAIADAYGAGCVVVLSSSVEGFPVSLVEAMFCGRATVSTDVGAVCEVIGGTGLVVPARNPRALADSCVALLRDPARRERLGAAARARALELFTVEQNVAAFRTVYLELMSRWPVGGRELAAGGGDGGGAAREGARPLPFARPPESHVPGRWAGGRGGAGAGAGDASGAGGGPLSVGAHAAASAGTAAAVAALTGASAAASAGAPVVSAGAASTASVTAASVTTVMAATATVAQRAYGAGPLAPGSAPGAQGAGPLAQGAEPGRTAALHAARAGREHREGEGR